MDRWAPYTSRYVLAATARKDDAAVLFEMNAYDINTLMADRRVPLVPLVRSMSSARVVWSCAITR